MSEGDLILRGILALLAFYVVVRATARTRAAWRSSPSETRLLWLVLLAANATLLVANVTGIFLHIPLSPAFYVSTLPLLLSAAVVTVPRGYRL